MTVLLINEELFDLKKIGVREELADIIAFADGGDDFWIGGSENLGCEFGIVRDPDDAVHERVGALAEPFLGAVDVGEVDLRDFLPEVRRCIGDWGKGNGYSRCWGSWRCARA